MPAKNSKPPCIEGKLVLEGIRQHWDHAGTLIILTFFNRSIISCSSIRSPSKTWGTRQHGFTKDTSRKEHPAVTRHSAQPKEMTSMGWLGESSELGDHRCSYHLWYCSTLLLVSWRTRIAHPTNAGTISSLKRRRWICHVLRVSAQRTLITPRTRQRKTLRRYPEETKLHSCCRRTQ